MAQNVNVPQATNVAHNPKPSSLTYIGSGNGGATREVTSSLSYVGLYSLLVTFPGSSSNEWVDWLSGPNSPAASGHLVSGGAGERPFTATVRIRAGSILTIGSVSLYAGYSDGTTSILQSEADVELSPGWNKITFGPVYSDDAKTISFLFVRFQNNGTSLHAGTFYVGGLDIREDTFIDSFISGDGPNSSWEGTADLTPSIREGYVVESHRGTGGQIKYDFTYYVVDGSGNVIMDISELVRTCSISVDMLAPDVKATMNISIEANVVPFWKDYWIRPHVTKTYPDGTVEGGPGIEGALGMFSVEPATERYDVHSNTFSYQGFDKLWLLKLETIQSPHPQNEVSEEAASQGVSINPESNRPDNSMYFKLGQFLSAHGFPPATRAFPPEPADPVAPFVMGAEAGAPLIEWVNKLTDALGWERVWMNLQGKLTTIERVPISEMEPDYIFEGGDNSEVRWPLEVDPEPDEVANRITVFAKHSGHQTVWLAREQLPAAHPFSFEKLGRWIDAPRFDAPAVKTLEAAKRIARTELDKVSVLPYTVRMKTAIGIYQLGSVYLLNLRDAFGDPIESISDPNSNGQGKFWCVGWQMTLGSPFEMTHNLKKILPINESHLVDRVQPDDPPLITDLQARIKELKDNIEDYKNKRKYKKWSNKKRKDAVKKAQAEIRKLNNQIRFIEG